MVTLIGAASSGVEVHENRSKADAVRLSRLVDRIMLCFVVDLAINESYKLLYAWRKIRESGHEYVFIVLEFD
jgi:hypothetical protein